MLHIKSPPGYEPERAYITAVLLQEFLGLPFTLEYESRQDIALLLPNGSQLTLPDVFFQTPPNGWLTESALPNQTLTWWDTRQAGIDGCLTAPKLPILYGLDGFTFSQLEPFPIDVFGSAFFMLTRYEENVTPLRDEHGRFPAKASVAYKHHFLGRPLINEYLELLWELIKRKCPSLERRPRSFNIIPTHDVDEPFEFLFSSPLRIMRRMAGDCLLRKDPLLALKNGYRWWDVKTTGQNDPSDTFDWIMAQSEKAGLTSAFYFMAGGKTIWDAGYPLTHPAVQSLMSEIAERGHEIGFHPSYIAADDPVLFQKEYNHLQDHAAAPLKGGRHHFLRIQPPKTWRYWAEAGLTYDSSLSYADVPGFRAGICYEYPVFDLEHRRPLPLVERPLILMEVTLLNDRYLNLSDKRDILQIAGELKGHCRQFGGDFVFLWHNSHLKTALERELFMELL
jgi:peptidoglycan/xylan/chitin deacetylase (PgdA/CDA1 family)